MPDRQSVQNSGIVSDDRTRDTIRRELHRSINIERRFTREQLATESGLNIHTIDAWLSRNPEKQRPVHLSQALSLASVLGERAVNSILGIIGYVARPLDEPDPLQPMQIAAEAMGHLSTIARNAADGRIDHTEEAETEDAADMLIAVVLPLSSKGKGR